MRIFYANRLGLRYLSRTGVNKSHSALAIRSAVLYIHPCSQSLFILPTSVITLRYPQVLPVEAVIGIGVGAAVLVIIGVIVAIVLLCCCR